jgi:hypothetical protein
MVVLRVGALLGRAARRLVWREIRARRCGGTVTPSRQVAAEGAPAATLERFEAGRRGGATRSWLARGVAWQIEARRRLCFPAVERMADFAR